MNCTEYLDKMTKVQQNVLEYIEDEDDSEDRFQSIKDLITKTKIESNQDEFKTFLYFLSKLSNNHQRTVNFFSKIDRILESLKDDLQKSFSNSELFHIFSSSKLILLFLIEMKILTIDEWISKQIIESKYLKAKYPQYFQPEIRPFINKHLYAKYDIEKEIPSYFNERRRNGENDNFICELIRKDSIDDFIIYMNQNNYEFNSIIKPSIYETNNFLVKKENTSLIEYAAFYGSIQIFNYLRNNEVELTPSLWYYAIHGNNAEIILILEDNQIKPENESYEEILKESIKCHHNDIAEYIQNNYFGNEESKCVVINGIKYRNFKFIKNEQINETTFNYLCKYDYYTLVSFQLNTKYNYCTLVSFLLNRKIIDINQKTIYKIIHFNSIFKFKITNGIYLIQS